MMMDTGFPTRNAAFGLPAYTTIAVSNSSQSIRYTLLSTHGPVVMIITYEIFIKPGLTDIDDWGHGLGLQFLAKLQAEKLRMIGYP